MSTWEDQDDSSFDVDSKEEANLCLLADVSTSNAESALDTSSNDEEPQPNDTVNFDDEDVIFKSREDLIKWYNQLLSASTCVSKAYRKLNKHFQHLEKEHENLKKTHQVHLVDFVMETTSPSNVQDTIVCEEVKELLNENVSSRHTTFLKDFQDLEEKVKSLTMTLEDSEEKHKEMLKQKPLLQKECTLANIELDKLKKKNSDLWTKRYYKKMSFDLNYKLKGHVVLKELPPEIVKIYEEIKTLRDKLGKFVGGREALNKIIKVQRNPKDKSGHGFEGKNIAHGKEVIVCYFCGKVGHETNKCNDLLIRATYQRVHPVLINNHKLTKKNDLKRFGHLIIK